MLKKKHITHTHFHSPPYLFTEARLPMSLTDPSFLEPLLDDICSGRKLYFQIYFRHSTRQSFIYICPLLAFFFLCGCFVTLSAVRPYGAERFDNWQIMTPLHYMPSKHTFKYVTMPTYFFPYVFWLII